MGPDELATRTLKADEHVAPEALAIPCLVVIFTRGKPACTPIPIDVAPIDLGRTAAADVVLLEDDQVSRRHARVALSGQGVQITDLGSRNGTFADGQRVVDRVFTPPPRLLRVGGTVLRFARDVAPFRQGGVTKTEGEIVGPTLRACREEIARAGVTGETVLLTGPSGSGKELAARAFHAATGRPGPFVAVNCAAIPPGLAERLLFGARRGAYSDANADAEGYVQAADRGTLFLDEIAELDAAVQPKLLRVLETSEVLALGDTRPRKVDVRLCAATLKDLRAEVAARRFREDLYYRIGRPEVRLPPLSERLEEVPRFVCDELSRLDARLAPSALFIEACAVRPWPGNVRELVREVRQAGRVALEAGRTLVEASDLAETAGQGVAAFVPRGTPSAAETGRVAIEEALRREGGNVTRAAKALGMHRNQLRRWLARNGVDPAAFGGAKAR